MEHVLIGSLDDFAPPGRKNHSKKWRSWSVILTNTQLIFLKDTIWALTLNEQIERLNSNSALSPGTLLLSTFTDFKPDEVIGLTESAAVYDRSYAKVRPLETRMSDYQTDSLLWDSTRTLFVWQCLMDTNICCKPTTSLR